jgi:hypothetical protein
VLPGTYDVQRSAADTAQLYSNITRRGFLGLQAKYADEDDGCPEVWTDNPTTHYSLKANGREKKVQFYEGCEGELPALEALRDIQREITEVSNLEQFFGSRSERRCRRLDLDGATDFASSYVLGDATGEALCTLRFATSQFRFSPSEWIASTCQGEVVSRGSYLRAACVATCWLSTITRRSAGPARTLHKLPSRFMAPRPTARERSRASSCVWLRSKPNRSSWRSAAIVVTESPCRHPSV